MSSDFKVHTSLLSFQIDGERDMGTIHSLKQWIGVGGGRPATCPPCLTDPKDQNYNVN